MAMAFPFITYSTPPSFSPLATVVIDSIARDGSNHLPLFELPESKAATTFLPSVVRGASCSTAAQNMTFVPSTLQQQQHEGAPQAQQPPPRLSSRVLCSGYLTKLGQNLPTWKRRYFELTQGTLFYFASDKERGGRPKGVDFYLFL
jgi:hypothetical protein